MPFSLPSNRRAFSTATHLCTPDTYDSSYRFLGDGSFVIRHTVHGPRKDYLSATTFRRRRT